MGFFDPAGNQSSTTNPMFTSPSGVNKTVIAAGKLTATTIKATSGILFGVLITTVGVSVPQAFDNGSTASGDIVWTTIASAPLGTPTALPEYGVICPSGITFGGSLTNPGMTVYWL